MLPHLLLPALAAASLAHAHAYPGPDPDPDPRSVHAATAWARSPPAATPQSNGSGPWVDAIAKAKADVAKLSEDDKVWLVTTSGWEAGPCVGNIPAIEKIGFKGLCLQDSPLGVRFADLVTVWPTGITTAATFSANLTRARGRGMGEEFRSKGANVQLGPGMNILRAPAMGRSWEMCGADPYLCGEAAYHTIQGVQATGVQSTAKHFILNDQEHNRLNVSSVAEERPMREIYLHPFLRAVQANVASVMCAYNQVNGTFACENDETLNKILKTEIGFNGYVMTDWGAHHSGAKSINAGLDMSAPGSVDSPPDGFNPDGAFPNLPVQPGPDGGNLTSFWGKNLPTMIQNGSVPASRLDDAAARILSSWYLLGQDKDFPLPNFSSFAPANASVQQAVNAMSHNHSNVAREVAAAGTVLLKNKHGALPLNRPKKLALVGEDAAPSWNGPNFFQDHAGIDGVLATGWGSGTAPYAYLVSPYEAIAQQVYQDRTGLAWSFNDTDYDNAQTVAAPAQAALVFLFSDSGEYYLGVDGNQGDRNNLTAWHEGDTLVNKVAEVNNNTIVVIHSGAQLDMEAWIEHPNVTAVVWAGMPGSEAGNALADVLYGRVNPSGRLPFTVAKQRKDYSADIVYKANATHTEIKYWEGLHVDYRWADTEGVPDPRFSFGHGLSYTTFNYSRPQGSFIHGKKLFDSGSTNAVYPPGLFDDVFSFSFDVTNTGTRDGFEVPQAYLAFPADSGEPPKVLRKFDRFALAKGETTTVTWSLNTYDLSVWSAEKHKWIVPQGNTTLRIGAGSRDIRLTIPVA